MTFRCMFNGRKKDRSGPFSDRDIRVTAVDEAAARREVGEHWEVATPITVQEYSEETACKTEAEFHAAVRTFLDNGGDWHVISAASGAPKWTIERYARGAATPIPAVRALILKAIQ